MLRSDYSDSKRGQQRGGGKKTVALQKLNKKYLEIFLYFFDFSFDFAFDYKCFASTDIATDQT